jgi:hypothetical protein
MFVGLAIGLIVALTSAFAAIVLGRNLTRSIMSGYAFLAAMGFALLIAGAGFLSLVVMIVGGLMLGMLQLIGWMLVDVDRDHLPPTDRPTWIARGIAFFLFGGGLFLLVAVAIVTGEFTIEGQRVAIASPAEIGAVLFGSLRDTTILIGLTIAASLLAVLLLLQEDEGRGR